MKETMKMKLLNDSQFTENVWLKKEKVAGVSPSGFHNHPFKWSFKTQEREKKNNNNNNKTNEQKKNYENYRHKIQT